MSNCSLLGQRIVQEDLLNANELQVSVGHVTGVVHFACRILPRLIRHADITDNVFPKARDECTICQKGCCTQGLPWNPTSAISSCDFANSVRYAMKVFVAQ